MELRKDYILDRWVIISESRGKRPEEFRNEAGNGFKNDLNSGSAAPVEKSTCFFCPGNEHLTPPSSFELKGTDDKWIIRSFCNKFPALSPYESPVKRDGFFISKTAFGVHEVLVETNSHTVQLSQLSIKELKNVLSAYASRTEALMKVHGIVYVDVIKNHGLLGGTSLVHSHSQILAYNKIPGLVKDEISASKKYRSCPFCRIAAIEAKSERAILENDEFVAFCPFASRFNYEAWIIPKRHITSITKMDEFTLNRLAHALQKILLKLGKSNVSYNYYLHTSPKGESLHFHIEVCPRIQTVAGFELSSNDIINQVSPESAANWYK